MYARSTDTGKMKGTYDMDTAEKHDKDRIRASVRSTIRMKTTVRMRQERRHR